VRLRFGWHQPNRTSMLRSLIGCVAPRTITGQPTMHLITFIGRSLHVLCLAVQMYCKFRMHADYARLQGSQCKPSSFQIVEYWISCNSPGIVLLHLSQQERRESPIISLRDIGALTYLIYLVTSSPHVAERAKESNTRIVRVHQSRT
jgi:hypothetical protein